MKTILVLTDFSISADYAADYALALAQNIEANLLLCNIFERPADESIPEMDTWPKQACERNSINDLGALMARLKTKLDKEPVGKMYKPEIDQCSLDGSVSQKLATIIAKHNLLLAVISAHSRHNSDGVFEKDHAWEIIDNACFPVMVIPYQTRFKPFGQIAFATCMNYRDFAVLESITALALYSNSEISITHISPKQKGENLVWQFFNQFPFKYVYQKILYQSIKSNNVINSLKQLCLNSKVDLLVLVHNKRSFLQSLFGQSVTRKMAAHPRRPLLVFPQNAIS